MSSIRCQTPGLINFGAKPVKTDNDALHYLHRDITTLKVNTTGRKAAGLAALKIFTPEQVASVARRGNKVPRSLSRVTPAEARVTDTLPLALQFFYRKLGNQPEIRSLLPDAIQSGLESLVTSNQTTFQPEKNVKLMTYAVKGMLGHAGETVFNLKNSIDYPSGTITFLKQFNKPDFKPDALDKERLNLINNAKTVSLDHLTGQRWKHNALSLDLPYVTPFDQLLADPKSNPYDKLESREQKHILRTLTASLADGRHDEETPNPSTPVTTLTINNFRQIIPASLTKNQAYSFKAVHGLETPFGHPRTLRSIGNEIGVSPETVRKRARQSFLALKKKLGQLKDQGVLEGILPWGN